MKKMLLAAIGGALAWCAFALVNTPAALPEQIVINKYDTEGVRIPVPEKLPPPPPPSPEMLARCDGRTRCAQMTSCEEAKHFFLYCPNVKMSVNDAGVPCDLQWCKGQRW